jgi:hypothetical protein
LAVLQLYFLRVLSPSAVPTCIAQGRKHPSKPPRTKTRTPLCCRAQQHAAPGVDRHLPALRQQSKRPHPVQRARARQQQRWRRANCLTGRRGGHRAARPRARVFAASTVSALRATRIRWRWPSQRSWRHAAETALAAVAARARARARAQVWRRRRRPRLRARVLAHSLHASMLADAPRVSAYAAAFRRHGALFRNATVLDVGAGASAILSRSWPRVRACAVDWRWRHRPRRRCLPRASSPPAASRTW